MRINHSELLRKSKAQQSPLLPCLRKSKKYKTRHHDKQNSLKHDLDTIIASLVTPTQSCKHKLMQKEREYLNQKILASCKKGMKNLELAPHPLLQMQTKNLKLEIGRYIQKLGEPHLSDRGDYAEFIRLSRESQDYLQYYLKNHFKQTDFEVLQSVDKSVILSLLKNNYHCLTNNPSEISARILLGLKINPLNDFHLVSWTSFSQLRKLATLRVTKSAGREFMVSYLMGNQSKLRREEFWAIVGTVLRKLEKVVNSSNVERLIERLHEAGDPWIPDEMSRHQLNELLINNSFFIWEEVLQLMFRL